MKVIHGDLIVAPPAAADSHNCRGSHLPTLEKLYEIDPW